MKLSRLLICALALPVSACGPRPVEVARPFFLMTIEDSDQTALFRCPNGPDEGCATDGLPAPRVIEAGADKRFVVLARRPLGQPNGPVSYYYFARTPYETQGWGNHPETIVGPLDEQQFAEAKTKLGLPDLTVRP